MFNNTLIARVEKPPFFYNLNIIEGLCPSNSPPRGRAMTSLCKQH